eukprot:COSAG02_NODE_923_length_15877_cov_26.660920_7_plen_122_part_00
MTRERELLGRVSKASQELFGQNAGLRALRVFETKTEELLRPESSWDERGPCSGAVSGNLVRKIPDLHLGKIFPRLADTGEKSSRGAATAFRGPQRAIPTVPVQLDLTAPVKIYMEGASDTA